VMKSALPACFKSVCCRDASWLKTPFYESNLMKPFAGRRRWLVMFAVVAIVYLLLAYVVLPALWTHHEHEPGLASLPMVTRTGAGIPGDALNVGIVGSKEDVLRAMHASGWFPADPITLRTSIEIVGSVVLDRPYHDAPVSPLYYNGKKEQLAFEKPDGRSADQRHHVRLWLVFEEGTDGRPVWLGSVTFDRGVGLSHDTGQVTHHIAPDIDTDRDLLMRDLREAKMVQTSSRFPESARHCLAEMAKAILTTRTEKSTSPVSSLMAPSERCRPRSYRRRR
jgi:hypothetical protein